MTPTRQRAEEIVREWRDAVIPFPQPTIPVLVDLIDRAILIERALLAAREAALAEADRRVAEAVAAERAGQGEGGER